MKLAVEASENPQLKHIVALSILSGCRKRELLDARWEDFDLERRNWRIPMTKIGKPRHVPLSSSALAVLAQIPRWEGCPYVLPNPKTKLPFVSYFYSWNTARKQAGLPEVRVHDLRHSFASNCVNQKVSIYEVATLLGHASVSTTAKYAHLSPILFSLKNKRDKICHLFDKELAWQEPRRISAVVRDWLIF